jgi:uncharacterized repeat protein (TIGR01451 family)
MKQKVFIAIYTVGVVLAVVLLYIVVTTIKRNPAIALSPEEKADITLAQYAERPNSTTTYGTSNLPILLTNFLFPDKEPLIAGCSLHFSFAPVSKTAEPGGTINYAITLTNRGKDICQNVSLSDYYSSQESFVASNPKPTASDYYWAVGNLGPAKEYAISLTTKTTAQDGGTMNAESCATADNSPDVCAQSVIFVQSGATKTLSLTDKLVQKINIPAIAGTIWGKFFNKKEFGIWVWDSPIKMTSAYAQQVISTSKQNGFNVIYLTVDDYMQIAQEKDDQASNHKASYMKALSLFVQAANSAGLEVDVVGGAKNWAEPSNRWKGYTLIDFVKEYNESYPNARIRNLQYDVEPYLLPDYDSGKAGILKEYVEFIDESAKRMQNVPAGFAIVIPHFYDKDQKWTPEITYGGETAYTYTHLLRVLAQKKDTEILIMAYRNFFDGENGTKQIAESEIKEASESSYATKIVVSQETGDVPPAYVTFHDYPKASLFDAISETQDYFGKYKNFGGTAVHYFDSFLKLQ